MNFTVIVIFVLIITVRCGYPLSDETTSTSVTMRQHQAISDVKMFRTNTVKLLTAYKGNSRLLVGRFDNSCGMKVE